jgi:hypothetical protein
VTVEVGASWNARENATHSRYLIRVPRSKAAFSGSRMYDVPGSGKPFGTIVPSAIGPIKEEHAGTLSIAQATESRRATRASFHAFGEEIS